MRVQILDRFGQELPEPRLIWADRLAICLFLLTGGLIGVVYALWGAPGAFVTFEKVAGCVCAAIWFAGRVIDFLFTGRIR